MSKEGKQYMEIIFATIRKVESEQERNIMAAADLMAKAIVDDKLIHVYAGGGHTWLPVAEIFYRAGGLACINPLMDLGLSPFNQALHYMKFERLVGYGRAVVDYYDPKEGDIAIIVHNIGVNPATIDATLALKERKVKIIAISSDEWQKKVPKDFYIRHPSNLNLFDLADICIDDYNPFGDAVVSIQGLDTPIAPISNIVDFYIMHRLEIETVKKLIEMKFPPPVWKSANVPGGDEYNRKLLNKYMARIKYL
ncbi:MAG: sugar isomerase domain-containing protein [Thermoproteota archaeon]